MSRLKEFAAAGLQILNEKPALVTQYGQVPGLLTAGPFVLLVTIASLVGPPGHSIPVPPRKPDMATIILNKQPIEQAAYKPDSKLDAGPYRSPLGGVQMDLYRDIFRLQAAGSMDEAHTLIKQLKDDSLMGHVLAQRYLHASYKAGFEELKDWLDRYADLPEADRIARLANIRMPAGHKGGLTPVSYSAPRIEEMADHGMAAKAYSPKIRRTAAQNNQADAMIKSIRRHIQKYEPSAALRLFHESGASVYLDDVEKDRIRAMVASGYLYAGKTDEALKLSGQALAGSRAYAPLAGWINGLAQWRVKNYGASAKAFEVAAESPYATGWMVSAAAYWAARAHQVQGNDRKAKHWLEAAAVFDKTFYGLLASTALGDAPDLDWSVPRLTAAQEREIMDTPAGKRAEKLLAAGEVTLAEAEIRALYIRGDDARKKALLAYAYDRKLPSLTMRLAHTVEKDRSDAALYPAMPWSPNKGYRIDRALLHAIARQESRFNSGAENKGSGATGLMQLMPRTAFHVAGVDMFHDYEGKSLLKNPEVSLDLGQKYVEELLNSSLVGQDLLSLVIAYNAGPGTLARWKSERSDINDPLLFIETIPYAETRTYVERVMANYWIYRKRFDQNDDSMQALADGKWARYAALDKGAIKFAAAE